MKDYRFSTVSDFLDDPDTKRIFTRERYAEETRDPVLLEVLVYDPAFSVRFNAIYNKHTPQAILYDVLNDSNLALVWAAMGRLDLTEDYSTVKDLYGRGHEIGWDSYDDTYYDVIDYLCSNSDLTEADVRQIVDDNPLDVVAYPLTWNPDGDVPADVLRDIYDFAFDGDMGDISIAEDTLVNLSKHKNTPEDVLIQLSYNIDPEISNLAKARLEA